MSTPAQETWDSRYGQEEYAYGVVPNDFLVEYASSIPKGRVLCLADGEGRNSVYLATLGYEVVSIDLSSVGLGKARRLASDQGVKIETLQADLTTYELDPGAWQGIVSIFAHFPPIVRRPLHRKVVAGLCAGGKLILEAFTPRQLTMTGRGGPNVQHADALLPLAAAIEEFADLELSIAREIERDVEEGPYHTGRCAVVQVVGSKP
ncbi:MAG: class I SAM-dependent methyltransferase [Fimbriimonas sp.]|nr:class I SAM-dependent methyltransferase [Fimbriimonas sp.]